MKINVGQNTTVRNTDLWRKDTGPHGFHGFYFLQKFSQTWANTQKF